eukprot:CAMPEP_0202342062 /NCGR_PEP_ID=MMETSP1126-20121109/2782_1 /ASSEMBLY_ACC=CAM_ASM_000457 /TAXON_ID=3047 /ORGANISM="Dunaliella tertiolecta, Strain CCMP1320" /LENGTH=420 /DNA_ID=CAMNT_0048932953 /DNA_START=177 /DNA_END=1439 /DNA_ORIENTATION=+
MLYTRRGAPLSLTADVLNGIKHAPAAYGVDTIQFLSSPSPEVLAAHGQGGHSFLSVPKAMPLIASNRDPTMYEYGAKPSTDQGAYVTIHSGSALVPPDRYMAIIAALQPDLYVALCDEITHDAKPKKIDQTIKRSAKWLDACMNLHSSHSLEGVSGMLAPIGGGSSPSERRRAAKMVADKPVAGFALAGFATGEAPGAERGALLSAAIEQLPANKIRYMPGMLSPVDLLDCVAKGVDLFDGAFPVQVTSEGYALCFPLQPDQQPPAGQPDVESGVDDTKINLWAATYRLDKGGLVPGCTCYACTRHSRAYVHHLLQTNEMLGEVLLEVHNTHHFQAFLSAVRGAIESGTFAEYHTWFKGRYLQQQQQQENQQGAGGSLAGAGEDVTGPAGSSGKRPAWTRWDGVDDKQQDKCEAKQQRTQ